MKFLKGYISTLSNLGSNKKKKKNHKYNYGDLSKKKKKEKNTRDIYSYILQLRPCYGYIKVKVYRTSLLKNQAILVYTTQLLINNSLIFKELSMEFNSNSSIKLCNSITSWK